MVNRKNTTYFIFLCELLSLMFVFFVASAAAQFGRSGSVSFTNVLSEYKGFSEIDPILLNGTDRSVHVPYASKEARLMRLNERTGEWEPGRERRICILGSHQIEVLPGQDLTITIDWKRAAGDGERNVFLLKDTDEQRPRKGIYRLYLSYSFDEWILGKTPERIYYAESAEFRIVE